MMRTRKICACRVFTVRRHWTQSTLVGQDWAIPSAFVATPPGCPGGVGEAGAGDAAASPMVLTNLRVENRPKKSRPPSCPDAGARPLDSGLQRKVENSPLVLKAGAQIRPKKSSAESSQSGIGDLRSVEFAQQIESVERNGRK